MELLYEDDDRLYSMSDLASHNYDAASLMFSLIPKRMAYIVRNDIYSFAMAYKLTSDFGYGKFERHVRMYGHDNKRSISFVYPMDVIRMYLEERDIMGFKQMHTHSTVKKTLRKRRPTKPMHDYAWREPEYNPAILSKSEKYDVIRRWHCDTRR